MSTEKKPAAWGTRVFTSEREGTPKAEPEPRVESLRAFCALLRTTRVLAGLEPEGAVDRTTTVVIRKPR